MKLIALMVTIIIIGSSCGNQIVQETTVPVPIVKEVKQPEFIIANIKEPLHTDYFDVTLIDYTITRGVHTNSEYTDRMPDRDSKYIVLDLKFKNMDTESRMISHGEVVINYKGRDLIYDQPENIYSGKWMTGIEQINPLTTHEGWVAYKLPKEIKGTAYYHPGRTENNQLIRIGEIK